LPRPADGVVAISDDYYLDGGFSLIDQGQGVSGSTTGANHVPGGSRICSHIDGRKDVGPAHQPGTGLTGIILPQDVTLPIAIDVSSADHMPGWPRIAPEADIG
jgi:hypothetical protein